jgi:hypothetical protein
MQPNETKGLQRRDHDDEAAEQELSKSEAVSAASDE